jgi:thiol:disulfide interchange protein DsbC
MRTRLTSLAAAAVFGLGVLAMLPLQAQQPASGSATVDPRIAIARKLPGAKPEDLRPAPVPGMYEWDHGSGIAYVTGDGNYIFDGDLLRLKSADEVENLSKKRLEEISASKAPMRLELLASVPESQMLVFSPQSPRYTVTVFTDIDCGYCRALHKQIAEYNRLGMKVRYLFYPRSGPGSESWTKAQQVWCSANRNDAFTAAIKDEMPEGKPQTCANMPIQKHWELVKKFGLQGTPGIILANGKLLPGYEDPEALLKEAKLAAR